MGGNQGVQIKSSIFFKNARRSGVWSDAQPVDGSAVTKGRLKVRWQVFEDLLARAVHLAYDLWPRNGEYLWHGMSVFAIDGSRFRLPASDAIRKEFDPHSGFGHSGKGHYPEALISTVFDVFRRLPVARSVAPSHASERNEAKKLIRHIPPGNVFVFDRGYPSYDFFRFLMESYAGFFVFRSPAKNTFPAVRAFLRSATDDGVISIKPSKKYLERLKERNAPALRLRIIRLRRPDGTVSVLITNLLDKRTYATAEMIDLYARRWRIEDHYRNEKVTIDIERFHSKSPNGVRQELFAAAIMTVIARLMIALSSDTQAPVGVSPQFKNAIITLAHEAALLVPDSPPVAVAIFHEILLAIARIKYYEPKKQRKSYPRVNKGPLNKWKIGRTKTQPCS